MTVQLATEFGNQRGEDGSFHGVNGRHDDVIDLYHQPRVDPNVAIEDTIGAMTRDPEDGLLATVRELGIGFVAYSPLGRGLLTGRFQRPEDLPEGDFRKHITPSADDLARIDAVTPNGLSAGDRYPDTSSVNRCSCHRQDGVSMIVST